MATRTGPPQSAPHDGDSHDLIRVHGARVNNLKDVSVEIPKRRLTVFTGVSGSGKSSLVFGTIAAESQRLINETYSTFVQGFMPTLARPEVDVLEGLTTAIIVDQERMGADPRSTVGTATDAHAMLRILFSRRGKPYIGSPQAFSFNVASISGAGAVAFERGGKTVKERRSFSITGGMCPRCEGRGTISDMDLAQLFDDSRSLAEGAILIPGYTVNSFWTVQVYMGAGFLDPDKPIRKYSKKERQDFLLPRTSPGEGQRRQRHLRGADPQDPEVDPGQGAGVAAAGDAGVRGPRHHLHHLPRVRRHPAQRGRQVLADREDQHRRCLRDADQRPGRRVRDLHEPSVAPLLTALGQALDSFTEIGLGYLALDRPSGTLSGGEAQRVKMVRQLGSALTDVTYVFDEPTIGLHPHDIQRMNGLLLRLRDKGNTVLVVEHKPETIAIADHAVDLGPAAGQAGGTVCYEGSVAGLRASGTITGRHLDDRASLKPSARTPSGTLEVRGATTHNLQDVDVDIPLGVLVVVTGVAGSGKSSLMQGSVSVRDGVVSVDQGAIRGSRRSNPATYTGLLDPIRKAFAKENGVKPALFSANSEGACRTATAPA